MKLLEILKAALTKFSKINMVQYVGILTIIATQWQGSDMISMSWLLMITGGLTFILKLWQSSGEMVSSGFSMDWSVWGLGLLGFAVGFLDTFVPSVDIMTGLFGGNAKLIMMAYMALTVILRTGFSNQTLNSKAAKG